MHGLAFADPGGSWPSSDGWASVHCDQHSVEAAKLSALSVPPPVACQQRLCSVIQGAWERRHGLASSRLSPLATPNYAEKDKLVPC